MTVHTESTKKVKKRPPPDPVTKTSKRATFQAGEWARRNRQERHAPYAATDPLRQQWERGWDAALTAECQSPFLLNAIMEFGMTTSLADLDSLTREQRVEILNWLDAVPVERNSDRQSEFDARRPSFIQFKGVTTNHPEDPLRVIAFEAAAGVEQKATTPDVLHREAEIEDLSRLNK